MGAGSSGGAAGKRTRTQALPASSGGMQAALPDSRSPQGPAFADAGDPFGLHLEAATAGGDDPVGDNGDDGSLPDPLRGDLEAATGADLGDVTLHTGPRGAATAAEHDARAVAIGDDALLVDCLDGGRGFFLRMTSAALTPVLPVPAMTHLG